MWPALGTEDRAISSGMLGMLAIIIVAALVFTLFDPAAGQALETGSQQATHTEASDHISTLDTIWSNILFYPLLLGAIFIIAKGVLESRRPG